MLFSRHNESEFSSGEWPKMVLSHLLKEKNNSKCFYDNKISLVFDNKNFDLNQR